MGKHYCDYCDVFLTHDSTSVRKAHNSGRNHLQNVRDYYLSLDQGQVQKIVDDLIRSYEAQGLPPPRDLLQPLSTAPMTFGAGPLSGLNATGGGFTTRGPGAMAAGLPPPQQFNRYNAPPMSGSDRAPSGYPPRGPPPSFGAPPPSASGYPNVPPPNMMGGSGPPPSSGGYQSRGPPPHFNAPPPSSAGLPPPPQGMGLRGPPPDMSRPPPRFNRPPPGYAPR